MVEAQGHSLTVSLPAAPVYVIADLTRLAQVLANLLHNASKYTPPGGRIELVTSSEGTQAVVRVRDSGIGIPAEILSHVFDYFAQEAPSSEANRRSLGVGLALVRQLVELHHGTVEATSSGRGEGSEFTVRLPLDMSPSTNVSGSPDASRDAARSATDQRRRVLVIDDQNDVADALAYLLRSSGHEVWTAYGAQQGIEAALEHRPDAALVDLAMPDMDGYEVARRLRERLPHILLVAITGLVRESDRARTRGGLRTPSCKAGHAQTARGNSRVKKPPSEALSTVPAFVSSASWSNGT
jgi:CheY-like chemotaxis protein/anti-sigma regulatory factor (Ser/Thr protein kinase)